MDELTRDRPSDDRTPPLEVDDLFEELGNRRRRYALFYLQQVGVGETVDIASLASQVAAWEHAEDPSRVDYEDRKNVQTSLYQFHVPKLEDFGLVEHDHDDGAVELTDAGRRVCVYPRLESGDHGRESAYLLSAAAAMTLLVFGAWLDVALFAGVPRAAAGLAGTVAFLCSAAVLRYRRAVDRRRRPAERPAEAED